MDGVAATLRIRGRETQTGRSRTPIMAVTANVLDHQIEAYRVAGMDGVVRKPVHAGTLRASVAAALSPGAPATGTVERRLGEAR